MSNSGKRIVKPQGNPPSPGSVTLRQEQFNLHTGPLPSPETLAKYDAICPGLVQVIVERAEKQSDHRMFLEKRHLESAIGSRNIGMAAGIMSTLILSAVGAYAIHLGHATEGATIITVPVVALAGAFMKVGSDNKQERIERAKMLSGQK